MRECLSCRSVRIFKHPDFLLVFPFRTWPANPEKTRFFHFCDPINSDARYSDDSLKRLTVFSGKSGRPYRIVSFDKSKYTVDIIRDLIKAVGKRPMLAKTGSDGCESKNGIRASDLFLKTVEEPPEDTLMILTTARPNTYPDVTLAHLTNSDSAATDVISEITFAAQDTTNAKISTFVTPPVVRGWP
jgi:hypothetical protein